MQSLLPATETAGFFVSTAEYISLYIQDYEIFIYVIYFNFKDIPSVLEYLYYSFWSENHLFRNATFYAVPQILWVDQVNLYVNTFDFYELLIIMLMFYWLSYELLSITVYHLILLITLSRAW